METSTFMEAFTIFLDMELLAKAACPCWVIYLVIISVWWSQLSRCIETVSEAFSTLQATMINRSSLGFRD
jgi:hypothetical protein